MFRALLFLFVLVVPVMASAQITYGKTQADYELVMRKVMQFYNADQPDSIYALISDKWENKFKEFPFSPDVLKIDKELYGRIVSYKYVGTNSAYYDEQLNPMIFFKVKYSKGYKHRSDKIHAMCISLDDYGKIYGWNFITISPYIDSMIANY